MEMKDILMELEEKLQEAKTQAKDWEAKRNFWKAAYESAETELKKLQDDIESLEMMIEAGKTVKVKDGETAKKTKQKAEKKEQPVKVDARHRGAFVVKINQFDNVEDRFKSQATAAKMLGWNQSSVCKFMQLAKDEQIRRKNFALVWEY